MKVLGYLSILKYNFKIIFNFNSIAAFALVLFTPVFFNLELVSYNEIAQTGELYLSVIGIILLTYICNMDERHGVKELIIVRRMPFFLQFLVRLFIGFVSIFLLQLIILSICWFQQGIFQFSIISAGIWITAVFLGLIGITISNVTNDLKSGYFSAFAYYVFELFTKGIYTKSFYLFSLLNGSFQEKNNLLVLIIIMIIFNCLIVNRSK